MNKLIVYCLILLFYLIVSKSLSPFEFGISYVNDEKQLTKLIKGAPVSAILIDMHTTGFAIKTYYMKLKLIYGFESYEELIVRSSHSFSQKYAPYLGLSIFRRNKQGEESNLPLIPGAVFLGDKNYGTWIQNKQSQTWQFFKVYRQIPVYLGWDNFVPTLEDYNQLEQAIQQNEEYFGDKNLFGPKGIITQKSFPDFFARKNQKTMTWRDFLKNYFNENFINYKEQL